MTWLKMAHKLKTIAVTGRIGIGKTCLSYTILEQIKKHKKVYVFKHPNPELIEKRGYHNVYEFGEIEHLQDCALYIDEPQLFIKRHEKQSNASLEALMTLCRQRDVTLIISSADTRFITRGIESYVDAWIIMDIDIDLVKQGSTIKKIIAKNSLITTQEWRLPKGVYLFNSRQHYEFNGKHTFEKLSWFTEEWSKPFRENKTIQDLEKKETYENTKELNSARDTPNKSPKEELIDVRMVG